MKKILTFCFLISLYAGYGQIEENYMESSLVKLNQKIPQFNFTNSEGKTVSLSDYKGKVILINFFATWCGPCMAEMPYLQKDIWNVLKDNKQFVLLSFGRDHSQEEVNKFIAAKKFTFPIFADKGKLVYNQFATKYIPRNYLIDQNGIVIYASTGFSTGEFEKLKSTIASLLKE